MTELMRAVSPQPGMPTEEAEPSVPPGSPAASITFEWIALATAAWLVAGAYLDAWAHTNRSNLETFFTPWHAVLYSGWLANTAFLGWSWLRGVRHGSPWRCALPPGYGLSLVGCIAFGVGGALDLSWHLAFGIEQSFSALTSPTHLILMVSAGLIVSGGLRCTWSRRDDQAGYLAVLSATLLVSIFAFWGQFDHPFTSQWAAGGSAPGALSDVAQELGVLGVVLHTAFVSGVVLSMVRRQRLPVFALTLLFGISGTLQRVIDSPDPVILVGFIGGLWADGALTLLRPSVERLRQFRLFALVLPVGLWVVYFVALIAADGVWWPVHVWTGAIVIGALTSWVVSYLVIPADAARGSEAPTEPGTDHAGVSG